MNELERHLKRLESFTLGLDDSVFWSRVLIVEYENITHGKPSLIQRSALSTSKEYAARFDEHLAKGYSWINLNAAGILGDTLLVVVELPSYVSGIPKDKVAVNLSGATMSNGKTIWNADERFKVVG